LYQNIDKLGYICQYNHFELFEIIKYTSPKGVPFSNFGKNFRAEIVKQNTTFDERFFCRKKCCPKAAFRDTIMTVILERW